MRAHRAVVPVLLALLTLAARAAAAQTTEPVAVKPQHTPPPVVVDTADQRDVQQQPARHPSCWRAQPLPFCSGFFITDIGVEFPLHASRAGDAGTRRRDFVTRLNWSMGFMGTRGRHSHGAAIGLTSDEYTTGGVPNILEYRYRHWLDGSAAFDAGVGLKANGVRQGDEIVAARGITGMIGYTPNRWIGATVRGDWVRARGVSHHGVLLGVQSTRASEFMFRALYFGIVQVILDRMGVESE